MEQTIAFTVNGEDRKVTTDPDRPLLEVLREELGLTGTKYGCGEGQCGACNVLVDGEVTRSCILPVSSVAGQKIQTVEGLASGDELHPVQEAFLDEAAFQCGFCTPGMIMATVGLLNRKPRPAEEEIREQLEGQICRCCGYPRILKAVRRAAGAGRKRP